MKTKLQQRLATVAPSIHIATIWEHDPDCEKEFRSLQKPGDCFHGEERDDWQPWQSEVRAMAIVAGEVLTGSAYLGATWEKAGDNPAESNPEISGYERQMIEEALRELGEKFTELDLSNQVINAIHVLNEA